MKSIIISTENVSDLDLEELSSCDISVINKNCDGSCLTTFETKDKELNEFDYYKYFDKLLDKAQTIVHLSVSSKFNSMYDMAVLGRDKLDADKQDRVVVIDSKNGSLALGLMLKISCEMTSNGSSAKEIETMVQEMNNHISAVYTSEELSNLPVTQKMNKFVAFFNKLFKVFGIFKINAKGKLQAFASAHSKQKAIKKLAKYIINKYDNYADLPVYILYSNCPEDAKMLEEEIKKHIDVQVNVKPIKTTQTAPKKALAMFFTSSSK